MRMLTLLTILSLAAGGATAQTQKTSGSKAAQTKSAKHRPFDDGSPVQVSDTSSKKGTNTALASTLNIVLPHPVNPNGLGHHGNEDPNFMVQHVQCNPPNGPQYTVQNDWVLSLTDTTQKQVVVLAAADGGHGVEVVHANASCTFANNTKTLSCAEFQIGAIQFYDGQGGNQLLACSNVEVDIQYH